MKGAVPAADKEVAPALETFARNQPWDSLRL